MGGMRFKCKMSRRKGCKLLRVEGEKDDQLVYVDAMAVRDGSLGSLVPLAYEQRGRTVRFSYAAEGFLPLEAVLAKPLAPGQFELMVRSFLDVLRDCEGSELSRQRVCTDPSYIFLNPVIGRLRFVYVPLQSFVSDASGMKGTLVYLCEHAIVPAGERTLRERVLDVARRMVVMTSTDFDSQLLSLGMAQDAPAAAVDRPSWRDSDQLGQRAGHGRDFVAAQQQEETRRALAESQAHAEALRRAELQRQAAQAQPAAWRQGTSQQQLQPVLGAVPAPQGSPVIAQAPEVDRSTREFSGWKLVRCSNGAAWSLPDGLYSIGRDASCSICLPQVVGLSRRHALIRADGTYCEVTDLASTNGVWVNGRRIQPNVPRMLEDNDQLALGGEIFILQ